MKTISTILFRLTEIASICIVILYYALFYTFLIPNEEQINRVELVIPIFKEELKNAEPLPPLNWEALEKLAILDSSSTTIQLHEHLIKSLFLGWDSYNKYEISQWLAYEIDPWSARQSSVVLPKYFTHKEIYQLTVMHYDYLNHGLRLEKAAFVYFDRPLNKLTKHEHKILIVALQNSSLYNYKRRPELVVKRIRELERRAKQ